MAIWIADYLQIICQAVISFYIVYHNSLLPFSFLTTISFIWLTDKHAEDKKKVVLFTCLVQDDKQKQSHYWEGDKMQSRTSIFIFFVL